MEYGSQVTGDASPTSMHDVIIIVQDTEKFHKDGLSLAGADYAQPHVAKWHAFLNQFGFNFYHTHVRDGEQIIPVKYAVISEKNFIRGCNGTLSGKETPDEGAFGLYVAGRMQKAALSPLYARVDDKAFIESAINTARIDGIWFALGFLDKHFTYEDLLKTYVSLSYMADVRIEKKNKVEILIERSQENYAKMLSPIIDAFITNGLIRRSDGGYEKINSLSKKETYRRLAKLKLIAFCINYLKNPLTAGLANGLVYAFQKIVRSRLRTKSSCDNLTNLI